MCAFCIHLISRPTLLLSLAETVRAMTVTQPQTRAVILKPMLAMSGEILSIRIPDSDVPVAAMALVQSAMPPVLLNHSLRTFLLGMIDARRRTLEVDEEACFVSSILHDLALLAKYSGDAMKSFEENGADLARTFSSNCGFSEDRAEKVAKTILLHAGQAGGMGADIEFVMVGAAQDVFGPSQEQLADDQVAAMEWAVPRLAFRAKFLSLLNDHVNRTKNPTWTAEFVSQPPPKFLMNRWSE
jgi:HD domain